MTYEARIYNRGNTTFFINVVWKTGQPHAKEWNWTTVSQHIQKVYLECIKVLNVRLETIKLLEENIDSTLFGTGLSSSSKGNKRKNKQIRLYVRLKSFCTKKNKKKMKRPAT